jgi:hypothetical protein
MSEQPGGGRPNDSIPVDRLTEAITAGVLRALAAQAAAESVDSDILGMVEKRGIFGQVVVTGGMWPTDQRAPILGRIVDDAGS